MRTTLTAQIQASNADQTIWQATHAAETVTAFEGETADQIARFVADTADTVDTDGPNWRVVVWAGTNTDAEPVYILDRDTYSAHRGTQGV